MPLNLILYSVNLSKQIEKGKKIVLLKSFKKYRTALKDNTQITYYFYIEDGFVFAILQLKSSLKTSHQWMEVARAIGMGYIWYHYIEMA